jgi:hypothetical protein
MVIGKHTHNDGSLALTAKEINFLQTSVIIYSLVPGLLVAAYFSRISQRRPRYSSGLLFTLLFISAWLFSAYLTAWDWRVEFGNTWSAIEVLLELVLFQTCTLPLIALGVLLNIFPHWLWYKANHRGNTASSLDSQIKQEKFNRE